MEDALCYLDFDYSEDAEGPGTFDAMATTTTAQVAAVQAEIARVLDWAHANFPDARAPLDAGGEWDYDLQGQREWSAPEAVDYDAASGRFTVQVGLAGMPRHTVRFTLSGTPAFCEAFRRCFGQD